MKENEVLVKVEGLSKKFCIDLKTSLWYGVKDLYSNIGGNKNSSMLRDKEFWAVKDISFELRRGECLGLIGHNGAGKSTLLKILNGLIKPDEGKVTIKGKVGALIELGAGFNPILSGRENIFNNGAILGFTRKEINNKIEEIIDFAEIREFIDMPVQNYSSGMKVRLGFAVAAQMKPDVLIIDEVLAVGDMGFILKCFKTIDEIIPDTAIIFVSHSMPMISRTCNKSLLLENGKSVYLGNDVGKSLDLYYRKFSNFSNNLLLDDGLVILETFRIENCEEIIDKTPQIKWGDDLILYLKIKLLKDIGVPIFKILIYDKEQRPVAIIDSKNQNEIIMNNGYLEFLVINKNNQFSKGIYTINLSLFMPNSHNPIYRNDSVLNFQIIHPEDHWQPFLLSADFKNVSKKD